MHRFRFGQSAWDCVFVVAGSKVRNWAPIVQITRQITIFVRECTQRNRLLIVLAERAVTLTMKQARKVVAPTSASGFLNNSTPEVTIYLDREGCVRTFRHFSNVLNRRIYGNAFRRFDKRTRIVPVIEHDDIHRWHYHAAIDCPPHVSSETFPLLIAEAWAATDFGDRQIEIKPGAERGWVSYMLKGRSKDEYDLSIDWLNFHNPLTAVA
jgi:hypothetical protein